MEGQFITNKETVLSDIINSILPKCDDAYFLVGYFYFSGFSELCEKIKDIRLRVLIGLEVERSIINGIKEIIEKAGYTFALLEKYTEKEQLFEAVADADALIVRSDKVGEEVIVKLSKGKT